MIRTIVLFLSTLLLLQMLVACNKPKKDKKPQKNAMYSWVRNIQQCPKEADYSPKQLNEESKALFKQARVLEKDNAYKHSKEIKKLYEQSAKLGNPFAMNNLVNIYYYGEGVEIDTKQALYWSQEINKLGIPMGDYAMAQVYELGIGVPVEHAKSYNLYNKAAQRGNPEAQFIIGNILISQFRNFKDAYHIWGVRLAKGIKPLHFH